MRKLLILVFAMLLALQGAMALARDEGPCCNNCHDIVACASASCPPCTGPAIDLPSTRLGPVPTGQAVRHVPQMTAGRVSFDIWRPPR